MSFIVAVLASLVIGAGLGYGFRGLINRSGKKAEADVKAEAAATLNKL